MNYRRAFVTSVALLLVVVRRGQTQQLGNKLLGSTGIDAGVQSPPGLFVIGRGIRYDADQIRDRNGNVVPIPGLDIDAAGVALGVGYTTKPKGAPYLTFAVGFPLAKLNVSSDNPAASLSGYGFSDMFVQPLKVGWQFPRFDVVSAYMVYIPTGNAERRGGGVGLGYWTHQLSVGGAAYFDSSKTSRISALASFDQNTRKRGLDARRGSMLQVQGGAGIGVLKLVVVGIAGYALWQVTPDRGSEIPVSLRGQRSRVFGLGPEIDVTIPNLRMRADFRIEREFGVESRSKGQVISVGLSYLAWSKAG